MRLKNNAAPGVTSTRNGYAMEMLKFRTSSISYHIMRDRRKSR